MASSTESRLLTALERIDEVTRDRQRTGLSHDDADDMQGTIACDDAIGFNPMPLLRSFHEHGVRVVIMGQVAGILHGSTELTGDLDLLWSGAVAQAAAMADGFAELGAKLWDDDDQSVPCAADAFSLPKVQFRTSSAAGDCCTPSLPWGKLDIARFLDRAESATVDGTQVHFVSRVDLISMRLAVGRPKDLRRAEELRHLR